MRGELSDQAEATDCCCRVMIRFPGFAACPGGCSGGQQHIGAGAGRFAAWSCRAMCALLRPALY